MSAAAESASFHYLQHKQVVFTPNFIKSEPTKVHLILFLYTGFTFTIPHNSPQPPTFEELWCVGVKPGVAHLRKEEKLYWRSRHRLEFTIEEDRLEASIMIHVREVESNMVLKV